ncbi:glycosyltransferase [Mucilaginibacter robiniae]|uniref:Glycosyltransferase n=1 Tax=Mucilaginibacter robiniae TaxID=2728022 RepID=A0A7L5E888_9SPHI|nr:glycosyltransferase [Mucilaginibacter robiniae]QJD96566.1 glycosyltransferase [Mucilaginibacter robiniae]
MRGSFVLVNYNRREELLITLAKTKAIIAQSRGEYEIVVVDNASTDGSSAAVKAQHDDVVLIENPVNTGAPAWNLGFARARGEYFIIIDDDSHVVSGLQEALDHMDVHQDIGVLALNVLTGPYTSAGWGWQDGQNIVGFIGCGAIYRKKVYEQVGGYADWIFLYANEWDLGLRVIDAGYRVSYFAGCTVDHRTSALNRTNKRLRVFVTCHEMGIVYKHFPENRWKYISRIFFNNMKGLRQAQFKLTWYHFLGAVKFFKIKKTLTRTPVNKRSQDMFLSIFKHTNPAFNFIKRDLLSIVKSITNTFKADKPTLLIKK